MRAVSLHQDVLVVTSAVLHLNCVIVRGDARASGASEQPRESGAAGPGGETFLIDSPVLPEELDTMPALIEQAGFPAVTGLLVTHGDWDHLLGRLAFPGVALGASESTVARLRAAPGRAQRELRDFDEELMIERPHPLSLGSVQPLPVPGRCDVGARELHLLPAEGHTGDGMAVVIPWAGVLIAGDYLSAVELPTLNDSGGLDAYVSTLERLRPLLEGVEHVVPGHGPVLPGARALSVLEEDLLYLRSLNGSPASAELPPGRRSKKQRELHAANIGLL